MKKTDYGQVNNRCYRNKLQVTVLVKCYYRNESLGVVKKIVGYADDGKGTPIFGDEYRIVILGDSYYSGLVLDFLYPKTQKKAHELADALNDVRWLTYIDLNKNDKRELRQKLSNIVARM